MINAHNTLNVKSNRGCISLHKSTVVFKTVAAADRGHTVVTQQSFNWENVNASCMYGGP